MFLTNFNSVVLIIVDTVLRRVDSLLISFFVKGDDEIRDCNTGSPTTLAKRHHSVRKVMHIIVHKYAFHKSCHVEVAIVHMFKFAPHWYKFTLPSTLAKTHTTVECANAVNISSL